MIPAAIRKVHEAKVAGRGSVEIWGDGCARREFLFAADLADCIHRCLQNEKFSTLPNLMNVGLGHDYTINEYYSEIAAVVGYDGAFEHDLDKPIGMKRKVVSIERQREWGWTAPTTLRDGLAATYEFFLDQEAG
jgi:GDP-L-fucose synthase